MRNSFAVLVLLYSPALFAQTVRVPFVGCESDGQVGPQEAPKGTDQLVQIKASAARRLAFYQALSGPGVLGPRGWYCLGTYGSSGSYLTVAPQPIKREDVFAPNSAGITGPAIQVDNIDGGTSGRFAVARVIARVFPAHRAFVQSVIDMFEGASDYSFGPYPDDKVTVQTDRLVEYRTPPRSEGLGTTLQFKGNDDPIDGVAVLEGQTPDLLMLRVRLPLKQRDLAPVIIQQLLVRQRGDAR